MRISKLREGGPYTIETFTDLHHDWYTNQLVVASHAVVYGDADKPSHCVRVFKFREE